MGSRHHGMVKFGVQIPMAPLLKEERASLLDCEHGGLVTRAATFPRLIDYRRLNTLANVANPADHGARSSPPRAASICGSDCILFVISLFHFGSRIAPARTSIATTW